MNLSPVKSPSRLQAIDLTKGWLVVLMVLYHTLNQSTQYQLGFRYLAFLPPSFILITGSMLTKVYAGRYGQNRAGVDRRLLVRGLKLLALFSLLNVMLRLTFPSARGSGVLRERGWNEIVAVFLVGDGYGVAFDVLIPIAYVLLLAPVIIRLNTAHRVVLPLCTAAVVCSVAWLESEGASYPNLALASVGVVGALVGRLPASDDLPSATALFLAVIFGAVCAGATARAPYAAQTYLVQLSAAASAVLSLSFGSRGGLLPVQVSTPLALLGRYSLLAYILQIAVLYAMTAAWGRPLPGSTAFWVFFLSTLLLTTVAAGGLDWLRVRVPSVDGVYRAVMA